MAQYIGYLHKEADSDYRVSFPDFPGCITAGESLEDARDTWPAKLSACISGAWWRMGFPSRSRPPWIK